MSNSLQSHGLQHARLPCPSLSPGVCSDSCPLSPWCHLTISSSIAPSTLVPNLSQHQGLLNESALCIRWPKYCSFSFSISPPSEYSGLVSFRIDWLVLLAVQGTLKSLLQHYSLKASIHWHSAFFMVQVSHLYITIGKTIALTRQTFVRKVMSLLFNTLSRFVMGFPSGASGKGTACQWRRHKRYGFDPWVGKIPWRRAWQPISVFLTGESHGQRGLEGYSPQDGKESDMTEVT